MLGDLSKAENDVQQKVKQLHDLKDAGKAGMISSSIFKTGEERLAELVVFKEGINNSMAATEAEGGDEKILELAQAKLDEAEKGLKAFNEGIKKDLTNAVSLCR